ncbi:MAG: cation transporting ATPase C-terminal domain-containing protein [Candidatus Firestonebacteria bacterium]
MNIYVFKANAQFFHTGWFIESLCTQTLVIYIIRTNKKPFIESWPSKFLVFTTLMIISVGIFLPFTPLGKHFGFVTPPILYFIALAIIIITYLFLVQIVKQKVVNKYGYD